MPTRQKRRKDPKHRLPTVGHTLAPSGEMCLNRSHRLTAEPGSWFNQSRVGPDQLRWFFKCDFFKKTKHNSISNVKPRLRKNMAPLEKLHSFTSKSTKTYGRLLCCSPITSRATLCFIHVTRTSLIPVSTTRVTRIVVFNVISPVPSKCNTWRKSNTSKLISECL